MTLTINKDSLTLLPIPMLRTTRDENRIAPENGFAGQLDRALSPAPSEELSNRSAKALAESLTLQMLQTSLALSGETQPETSPAGSLPSAASLIQAYRSSLQGAVKEGEPSPASPPRVQETAPVPVESRQLSSRVVSGRDTAWLEPIIAKASRRYGVDVGLIKAVIKAESNFNPQAVSHAGARGLMQLMPATARSLGVSDSFDPEQNVMAGTRFLGDLIQRYNGDIESALAAYNWGPANVDRRPDRLPRETRDYLAKVKQLYSTYSS